MIAAALATFDAQVPTLLSDLAKSRLVAELETPPEEYVCPACSRPGANHESTAFAQVFVCCCPCHGGPRK